MTQKISLRALWLCVLFSGTMALAAQDGPGFLRIDPSEIRFKSPLGVGPETTVLFGDLSKPGLYVVRNKFPPGVHSARISIREIVTPR
jgi:hypothetical protein